MAEHCRTFVQFFRNPVGAVIKHRRPQKLIAGSIFQEIPDTDPGVCLNFLGQAFFASGSKSVFLFPDLTK